MDKIDNEKLAASLEGIEKALTAAAEKAEGQAAANGKIAEDLKTEISNLGQKQTELANELMAIKQKGGALPGEGEKLVKGWGQQLVESDQYKGFQNGQSTKMRIEVKNTLVGVDANVPPARAPGVVPGAFQPLTIEQFLTSVPTTSNAIEFTREASFTNSAAEAAEGAAKAESALTWALVNMPISTVAHFIKISKQLAADHAALAAYVDLRMRYGVNRRVETQLGAGDGIAPNISGILDTGNFTAHGYADAALGSTLKKLVLIRKILADLEAAGDPGTGIMLNPADWGQIEIDLFTTAAGQMLYSINSQGQPALFGRPVISSVGITADNVVIGNWAQSSVVHNREGVVVELSDSDSDNFTKNLITIRAERRLALATERPAAVIGGDLTPA